MVVVAKTVTEAIVRALAPIVDWKDAHRHDFYDAKLAFALSNKIGARLHIYLIPAESKTAPAFASHYNVLK